MECNYKLISGINILNTKTHDKQSSRTDKRVNIQALEKVQRRAARWVLLEYGRHSSVTRMLAQLGWSTLQHRRFVSIELYFFIKLLMELSLWHSHRISY